MAAPVRVGGWAGRGGGERGRDDRVREGTALLARARLVTLTGPGGNGKTRLSLQIAADLLDSFADGVYFVALSAVRDPAIVASAIPQALRVPIPGSRHPHEALLDFVRAKRCLIVLDTFEHLLPAPPTAPHRTRAHACARVGVRGVGRGGGWALRSLGPGGAGPRAGHEAMATLVPWLVPPRRAGPSQVDRHQA